MGEEEVSNESESSENSSSDDPKTPENEVNEYEKQRQLRIDQNRARVEALGLRKIANSLMNLSHKGGEKKSKLNSKKGVKNGKDDGEYEPDDENPKDDSSDCSLDESSDEFEEGKRKKKKQKKKVELASGVLIPDSSLQIVGHCGEKICLMFPKAPKEEVKDLMNRYPKGFNGFNREQGERALRYIAGLKADYCKLRRSHFKYPEFREEVVEGLPFPEGFNGFNLEESKEISRVIVSLEDAYSRLRSCFQSEVQGAESLLCPEASCSRPMETFRPPTTQVPRPQWQASTCVAGPVQPNVPMYPDYRQFPPYWCPPMVPFGMSPVIRDSCNVIYPPPYMDNYSGRSNI
ncbi:uncharacterized protein [Spinacia oleracea]|uniref:Uncharacterized protein isoform X1 n=1 Tax=Spinacia oleracea TaxID=3562 RepID=A0A9R0JAI9_SPIOL|nr:uncharacterized protein LOC110803129 isoform X1 [Spinacia oleracea]